jgi:hypothetical protein
LFTRSIWENTDGTEEEIVTRRVSFAIVIAVLFLAHVASAQKPNVQSQESTVTATVDAIDRSTRLVTFRTDQNVLHTVYVGPEVTAFKELQVGDVVTARYRESTVVRVTAAGPAPVEDATQAAQAAGPAGRQVLQSLRAVVTVEAVDPENGTIDYRTSDNLVGRRLVSDKKLLEGLRPGQRIEVTFTRERAVSIERAPR